MATLALRYPLRTAVLTGLALAQIGEFSFVLARAGMVSGLIGDEMYQVFIAAAVITMLAAPFCCGWLRSWPIARRNCRWRAGWRVGPRWMERDGDALKDHVIMRASE